MRWSATATATCLAILVSTHMSTCAPLDHIWFTTLSSHYESAFNVAPLYKLAITSSPMSHIKGAHKFYFYEIT